MEVLVDHGVIFKFIIGCEVRVKQFNSIIIFWWCDVSRDHFWWWGLIFRRWWCRDCFIFRIVQRSPKGRFFFIFIAFGFVFITPIRKEVLIYGHSYRIHILEIMKWVDCNLKRIHYLGCEFGFWRGGRRSSNQIGMFNRVRSFYRSLLSIFLPFIHYTNFGLFIIVCLLLVKMDMFSNNASVMDYAYMKVNVGIYSMKWVL
jgi:hypothetical protein